MYNEYSFAKINEIVHTIQFSIVFNETSVNYFQQFMSEILIFVGSTIIVKSVLLSTVSVWLTLYYYVV